ncbi:MAG: RHS repeat-associated core domain-containing protein [Kineosporiaceae bacterium]
MVGTDAYDFKGNLLHSTRQVATVYDTVVDWSGVVALLPDTYGQRTRYDALNRPVQEIAPHSDQPGSQVNVVQRTYDEAGLLDTVDAWLAQAAEPGALLDPATASLHAVTGLVHDAKGQRQRISYGNGTFTEYAYDRFTFRLERLTTRRGSEALQDLNYAHDPVGNITTIRDDAQPTLFFRNTVVAPTNDYLYDAVYRLIEATGREHLGQNGAPVPASYNDAGRVGLLHPGDGQAMGRYLERYVYDAAGNILSMQHRGSDPANPGWTRDYTYAERRQLEPGAVSNRLTSTAVGNSVETYSSGGDGYDAHGNMLRMPQLQAMQWDFRDHLRMTRRQAIDATDADGLQRQGERTWYVYGAGGERVRKITQSAAGTTKDERIYLGGAEIHRRGDPSGLVRETLILADDKQRIALLENRVSGQEPGVPQRLDRFQVSNHLGSATHELDGAAQLITYEEFTPYGSSAYQAVRNQVETPKRYRYTGKERDEESGLSRHGLRFYASWLARWISPDPAGLVDGTDPYQYCRASPTRFRDPTGENAVEDLFKFLRDTGGFSAADMPKGGPPQFTSAHASPFGTAAHQSMTNLVDEVKGLGGAAFKGIERIYAEVAVQHGTNVVTKIGGSPIAGHHNLDLVAMPQEQSLSVAQTLTPGAAEAIGDAKFGGGTITAAHSSFGQTGITVNGASSPSLGPSLGAASETEQAFASLAQEFALEPASTAAPATPNPGPSFDLQTAKAMWNSMKAEQPQSVLGSLKSGAGKVLGFLGNAAAVAGAGVAGYQVGTGIDEVATGKTGAGVTDLLGGGAQLGISIGVPAAVKAGTVAVGGGAGALALVSGLAGASIGWAVEDTKRALEGKRTMTDEAVDYWSAKGFSRTMQDFWWQLRN